MNEGEEIRFIDLFSGIGGFRKGLEDCGRSESHGEDSRSKWNQFDSFRRENEHSSPHSFRCVWSCDNNKYANQIYTKHFGEANHYSGDVRGVDPREIPDFDLLCAGFPCQSFSVAGKRKGFQDTRGTLFFEISRIAEAKRPQMLLLENVKGLLSSDRGQTFQTILQELGRIGYWAEWQVLNSKHHGVPQNRERVFIIGHSRNGSTRPIFPVTEDGGLPEPPRGETLPSLTGTDYKGPSKQRATALVLDTFNVGGAKEEEAYALKTNPSPTSSAVVALRKVGDIYEDGADAGRIYSPEGIARTLKGEAGGLGGKTGLYAVELAYTKANMRQGRFSEVCHALDGGSSKGILQYGSMRSQKPHNSVLLPDMRIRRLTPVECERLQGFPDGWTEGIADTNRYKCLGNAVTTNVITFLGKRIMEAEK